MVILGAGGMAKELLQVLDENNQLDNLVFFDNVNADIPECLYDRFPIIKSWEELNKFFKQKTPEFAIGVGGAQIRYDLSEKAKSIGGRLCSIISNSAKIGNFGNHIDAGVSILSQVLITCDVYIGEGTLVNETATVCHDARVGRYCEIAPGAKLLGKTKIGDFTEIGANAVILPNKSVGSYCKIGTGAVVTKSVPDNSVYVGIPAKPINKKFNNQN